MTLSNAQLKGSNSIRAPGPVCGASHTHLAADISNSSSIGQSVLTAADAAAIRTLLSLVVGTDVQGYDAELAALAALTSAADKLPYFDGAGSAAVTDLTSAARSVLDDSTVAAMVDTLGGASSTGSGGLVRATSPTLVTPNIGAASGTSLAATSSIKSSGSSGGIGYATGAGGSVTQITSKATAVALDAMCGNIVTHNATLNAGAEVTFNVNNNSFSGTDNVIVNHAGGGTAGAYGIHPCAFTNGAFRVTITNLSGSNLGEALTLRFTILKSVTS